MPPYGSAASQPAPPRWMESFDSKKINFYLFLFCFVLFFVGVVLCILLYSLYCTVFTVLFCILCIVLFSLYCTVFNVFVLYSLYCSVFTVLHCIHCVVLYSKIHSGVRLVLLWYLQYLKLTLSGYGVSFCILHPLCHFTPQNWQPETTFQCVVTTA